MVLTSLSDERKVYICIHKWSCLAIRLSPIYFGGNVFEVIISLVVLNSRGLIPEREYLIINRRSIKISRTEYHGSLNSKSISDFVKKTRKSLSITQKDLALNLGTGLRFIVELELGNLPVSYHITNPRHCRAANRAAIKITIPMTATLDVYLHAYLVDHLVQDDNGQTLISIFTRMARQHAQAR